VSQRATTTELRIRFGSNLRRVRLGKRLSQRALKGGQKTVSAVERGEVNLSLDVMERLAWAVGADVVALLTMPVSAEAAAE
jgi:transcriptional regulator with XRE-family HTH domain